MTVYSYKVARDLGFAPNPFFGACTLATCKPQIRNGAEVGDIIIGLGAKQQARPRMVIFAMRVAEKLVFNGYWTDRRFAKKVPFLGAGWARAYGDNIYYRTEGGEWCQADSHHSLPDGGKNTENCDRDVGSEAVLIAREFSYFGDAAIPIPPQFDPFEDDYLFPAGRNFRNSFTSAFEAAVSDWFETLPRGRLGLPSDWTHC